MKFADRFLAIAHKEASHILRDPFTLGLALGLPLIMVVIFGYAFEFNLDKIPMSVFDNDYSPASRSLCDAFESSSYFKITRFSSSAEAIKELNSERSKVSLIIKPGFERDIGTGSSNVQILVDGSDNTTAGAVLSYLATVRTLAERRLFPTEKQNGIDIVPRFIFNSELSTKQFIIPALGGVVMAILSILLTSLSVAREWEAGSMELLLSTPVKPIEIIIGKLIPYLILGLASAVFIYITARIVFKVNFLGSLWLYFLGCLIFIATCMAQGIVISIVARNQLISMQAAVISGMLPSLLFSGFVYPIENMPRFFFYFTSIIPARWFVRISREIFLKGSTFPDLYLPFTMLAALALFMIILAAIKFKKDLEP